MVGLRRSTLGPIVLLFLLPSAALAQAAGKPVVTAGVQVTANPAPVRGHSTPQIAVNPLGGELVIVESDPRGRRTCDAHISVDAGRSWFGGGTMMVEPYTDCSFFAEYGAYATLAFARDGTLYVAFVASEHLDRARDATPRHVFLARSTDGGRTFATTTVFRAPDGNPDRGLTKGPMLAVDPRQPNRVYVGWRQGVFNNAQEKLKSNIASSADGGKTFSAPVDLTDERGGDYPGIAVGPDGTVHAVYWTRTFPAIAFDQPQPVRPIMYLTSTDRGRSFSKPREIDPGNQRAQRPPLIAADPGSRALYVVWYGHADPQDIRPDFQGDMETFLRASGDGGKTWSDRVLLNDDAAGGVRANQFDPGISVAPNGRVDVAWYDGRNSPKPPDTRSSPSETGYQDVYAASSTNLGRSFGPNVRITDRSIDRSIGVYSNNLDSHFNVGVASTKDAVHFAWQDSREGDATTGAEDVYAGSMILRAPAGAVSRSGGIPLVVLVLAGAALGMGVAMAIVWVVSRRPEAEPTPGG